MRMIITGLSRFMISLFVMQTMKYAECFISSSCLKRIYFQEIGHSCNPLRIYEKSIVESLRFSLSSTATLSQESSTQDASPSELHELGNKFQSYASNISRSRKGLKTLKVTTHNKKDGNVDEQLMKVAPSPASMSAVRSLLFMMNREIQSLYQQTEKIVTLEEDQIFLISSFNRAIVQAARASSECGDYNMISKIVNTALDFSTNIDKVYNTKILEARFFGEAITEMSKTQASYSKLKRLWNSLIDFRELLHTKPSSYELNSMILAHVGKGRVRAALEIYNLYGKEFGCDEYTASALMNVLADSIAPELQNPISEGRNATSSLSPCWQWSDANRILNDFERMSLVNNQVYAAALKVNDKAMEVYRFPGNRHYGAKIAMSIFKRMQRYKISPDVVTCSMVMSAFDKGRQWKAAKALLAAMEKPLNNARLEQSEWVLPKPNVYTYTSAISSCARCSQFEDAIEILDHIREKVGNSTLERRVSPNRWVYNAAISACVPPSQNWLGNYTARFNTAVQILRRMEEDASCGHDTAPDTVSYNTVLAAVSGLAHDVSKSRIAVAYESIDNYPQLDEQIIEQLIDEMSQKGLKKDHVTYRNAIVACRSNPDAALRLLERALADRAITDVPKSVAESADELREYLIQAALSVCASNGRMDLISKLFKYFQRYKLHADSRSMVYLVKGLSRSLYYEDSMAALNAMKGDGVANSQFLEKHDIDIIASANISSESPIIQEGHYSVAISGCLRQGELFQALKILNAMKLHGLTPNDSSLRGIILAYCKLATDEATREHRIARKEYATKLTHIKGPLFKANNDISRSRAEAALAMMQGLQTVPIRLKCVVASACAATGMWNEAKELLWSIHIAAVQEKKRESSVEAINIDQGSALSELPKLHKSLLKLCARSGNINAALRYTDAIQDLRLKLEGGKVHFGRSHNIVATDADLNQSDVDLLTSWDSSKSSFQHGIGMSGEDWKLVMIAASKSAHWKVCLGTLPFIQPFVEATHPSHASEDSRISLGVLNREYDKLSRALTAAVLAFEIRSQYAWAVRSIVDWMEWSGRRPPKEAVFSACRALSSRGQGGQVTSLVNQVLRVKDHSKAKKKLVSYETSYEMAVYIEAITALVNNGLYDSADELYLDALSRGSLPFTLMEVLDDTQLKLDLHGMTRATAHSAVRVALQQLAQTTNGQSLEKDILIVTGKGKRSDKYLRPVLRPEVQRMLIEEFYPPISTFSEPKNTGALRISHNDVNAWLDFQKQQKGVRFLAVAEIIKNITLGTRLKKILSSRTPKTSD